MPGVPPLDTAAAHPSLDPTYFRRMASSLGDKSRILPWVLPGHVVDAGAGGGELSVALSHLPDVTVTAVDYAPESLERLKERPGIGVLDARVGASGERLPIPLADTFIYCAILHEVYSYSPDRWDAVRRALTEAHATLRPGGRLIIRDGVMPDDPDGRARFTTPDDALVEDYLALSPHAELRLARDGQFWTGTRHAVAEALFTITWGREALPREALERYQLVSDYGPLLAEAGFTLVHDDTVVQPGYVDALAQFRIETASGESWAPWFPATNALWVAERNDAP